MESNNQNTTTLETDLLLISYAASSFLAFVLAFSKEISSGQSASCFAISCVLALIGMNIGRETGAAVIDEDEDFY